MDRIDCSNNRFEGTVVEAGEIRAASADGRIPFIDTRDIADAAFATLTE
jgi:hypothetical protein